MEALFGVSAGVMLAASFFSLLGPAVDYSKNLPYPGWIPVLSGFLIGVAFIKFVESFLPDHAHSPPTSPIVTPVPSPPPPSRADPTWSPGSNENDRVDSLEDGVPLDKEIIGQDDVPLTTEKPIKKSLWILIIAVTLHNIPEGTPLCYMCFHIDKMALIEHITLQQVSFLVSALVVSAKVLTMAPNRH
jgi:zinc transporter ZupT